MEVGIDLEQNDRFIDAPEKLLARVFTDAELDYAKKFEDIAPRLCAMWCIKEAAVKAFSNAKLGYRDIEVLREPSGKPYIKMTAKIKAELEKRGLDEIKISLSHTKTHSTAICILI